MTTPEPDYEPTGFFALRTPLLPHEAPADEASLVESLRAHLRDPVVREALFVASPSLFAELPGWLEDPLGPRHEKTRRALVRYWVRMTSRCTPFGLFAGCSVGTLGERTELRLQPRASYRRAVRLDFGQAMRIVRQAAADNACRARMRFQPSSGHWRVGDRLRYAEVETRDEGQVYRLSEVTDDAAVRLAMQQAQGGATLQSIASALVSAGLAAEPREATDFAEALVAHQLLVPASEPAITGAEPLSELCDEIGPAAGALRVALDELQHAPLGVEATRYMNVANAVATLVDGDAPSVAKTVQVDMFKPVAHAKLGPEHLHAMHDGIDALRRTSPVQEPQVLVDLRRRFRERWEDAEVPLAIVCDSDLGVLPEPELLPAAARGLPIAAPPDASRAWEPRHRVLLARLLEARARGQASIDLDDATLDAMAVPDPAPLPDAFGVPAVLCDPNADGPCVVLSGVHGPSGARMLGRFCHGDDELRAWVERHLRQEEALRPDAVFAEIVHMPQGRLGNIVARPVLREHEIAFQGRGRGACVLDLHDLTLRLAGDRLELRSRRLGCEVIPRLSSAHDFSRRSLGPYRLLCMLQDQQGGRIRFDWGPLGDADHLPRVVRGRAVLSLARWRFTAAEIAPLHRATKAEARVAAAARLRAARGLPRHVVLRDGDNALTIDLEHPLVLETFAQLVQSRPHVVLHERFPAPEAWIAEGPEGRYAAEVVVPFVRRKASTAAAPRVRVPAPTSHAPVRYAPGSQWLYAKIYTGPVAADHVLAGALAPVARKAVAEGLTQRWFFIRYGDPGWHVRLRLQGDPRALLGEVLPRLHAACAPLLADEVVERLVLDTYVPEIVRYGGAHGMPLCEDIFFHESDAVVASLDTPAHERWWQAVSGVHALLESAEIPVPMRVELLSRWAEGLRRHHTLGDDVHRALARKLRTHRDRLDSIIEATPAPDARHHAIARLARAAADGRLTSSLAAVAGSLAHMCCNRIFQSGALLQELVVYELLARTYRSQVARTRALSRAG